MIVARFVAIETSSFEDFRGQVMMNYFRYVERSEEQCVELRLFTSAEGNPQGDVSGPVFDHESEAFSDVVELVRCSSLDDAFQAGIRMANRTDRELVISGNSELWLTRWGSLDLSRQTEQPAAQV